MDGLAIRDKVVNLEIEPKDIPHIINLLSLPFIKAIQEVSPGKYIFTLQVKDVASLFHLIADLLCKDEGKKIPGDNGGDHRHRLPPPATNRLK